MRFRFFAPLAALLILVACSGPSIESRLEQGASNATQLFVDSSIIVPKQQNAALVIGISYAEWPQWALKNTVADARDVEAKLKEMNYDVELLIDPSHDEVWDAVYRLSDTSVDQSAGLRLFYFAGHGLQDRGRNFLVTEIDDDDRVNTIGLQNVIAEIGGAHNSLFFFDACRTTPGVAVGSDNSFVATARDGFRDDRSIGLRLRDERQIESSGLGVQLSNIANTFIMYSTAPNQVAFDGVGENSPFAEAFLEHIDQENANLDEIATEIARGTWARTERAQDPWKTTNALTSDIFLRVPRSVKISG